MSKFFRNIPRHFKEARQGIFRNFGMTVASALAVTITLLMIAAFLIASYNLDAFMDSVEHGVQIHCKIENVIADDKIESLQRQIEAIDGVANVYYSDKNKELDALIEAYGDDGVLFEAYRGDANPLKRAFIVDVNDGMVIDDITSQISSIEGIESALYGGDSILKMMSAFDSVKRGGSIAVLVLSALAIFLISNTIKLTIVARRDEIHIMRLVGASNGYIRTPFVLEGIVVGLLGAALPMLGVYYGYNWAYVYTNGYLFSPLFSLIEPVGFVMNVNLILAGIGVIVGLIGSYISVSKYLWWKR